MESGKQHQTKRRDIICGEDARINCGGDDGETDSACVDEAFDRILSGEGHGCSSPRLGRDYTSHGVDCDQGNGHPDVVNAKGTRIAHCRQFENWDCGVACVQMILRWFRDLDKESTHATSSPSRRQNGSDERWGGSSRPLTDDEWSERAYILDLLGTKSIWTIDLVLVLHKLLSEDGGGAPVGCRTKRDVGGPREEGALNDGGPIRYRASCVFCSANLGVDDSYSEFSYYENAFREDGVRVRRNFARAAQLGLSTRCVERLSVERVVVRMVSRIDCVAIALVDNRILCPTHPDCQERKRKNGSGFEVDSFPGSCAHHSASRSDEYANGDQIVASTDRTKRGVFCCDGEKGNEVQHEPTSSPAQAVGSTAEIGKGNEKSLAYAGHYIIICGISWNPDELLEAEKNDALSCNKTVNFGVHKKYGRYCLVLKNPGRDSATHFVTPEHFERAWRASGTDEDIIFLSKHRLKA